jgi:antitoxin (DNA-binding transcriptional repressor) of toxin-antitoxin stability system
MNTVTVDEVAADPAGWLRRVEAGEAMRIVRDGRELAALVPIDRLVAELGQRPFGLCKGEFVVPDDFDAPLSEDELKLWYGE